MGSKTEVEDTIIRNSILDNCRHKVQTHNSSSSPRVNNSGISNFVSTGTQAFTLEAPAVGSHKRLVKSATASAAMTVTCTGGATLNAAGNTVMTFDAADDMIELMGISTTRWVVIVNSSVALS